MLLGESGDPLPPRSQIRQLPRSTPSEITNPIAQQSSNSGEDYSLQWNDFLTMVATVRGGFAYRNKMIPIFADELKNSVNGDIYEVFLKTRSSLQKEVPDQIPEFRSTLTKKLSLRNIFQP